jgi:16S rRNA (guanine527-N7)-methyltransferase
MTRRVIATKLNDFSALFLKWNKSINLSAARTAAELEEHITDSLALVDHLTDSARHLDVGSGGGFPVVVAAIACPQIQFVALEPVHKKQAFLRTAARELDLPNLDALAIRLEDHDVRDYDSASSRATFDLADWLRQGLGFVRPGGRVLGFEGVTRDDLPASVERYPYELGGKSRAIVALRKPAE